MGADLSSADALNTVVIITKYAFDKSEVFPGIICQYSLFNYFPHIF